MVNRLQGFNLLLTSGPTGVLTIALRRVVNSMGLELWLFYEHLEFTTAVNSVALSLIG